MLFRSKSDEFDNEINSFIWLLFQIRPVTREIFGCDMYEIIQWKTMNGATFKRIDDFSV